MQQTSKYQFNLIEGTDDFSPTPLNDNMEKVEEELSELNDTVAQHTAAIGTGGHNCRIAFGSYTGNGLYGEEHPNRLEFDFTPMLVLIGVGEGSYPCSHFLRPANGSCSALNYPMKVLWEGSAVGWHVNTTTNPDINQMNTSGTVYHYVAIGYDT